MFNGPGPDAPAQCFSTAAGAPVTRREPGFHLFPASASARAKADDNQAVHSIDFPVHRGVVFFAIRVARANYVPVAPHPGLRDSFSGQAAVIGI
jgi:hypothetical protein